MGVMSGSARLSSPGQKPMNVPTTITNIANGTGVRPVEVEEGGYSRIQLSFPAPEAIVTADFATQRPALNFDLRGLLVPKQTTEESHTLTSEVTLNATSVNLFDVSSRLPCGQYKFANPTTNRVEIKLRPLGGADFKCLRNLDHPFVIAGIERPKTLQVN